MFTLAKKPQVQGQAQALSFSWAIINSVLAQPCLETHIADEAEAEAEVVGSTICLFTLGDVVQAAVEISAAGAVEVAGLRLKLKSLSKNSRLDP